MAITEKPANSTESLIVQIYKIINGTWIMAKTTSILLELNMPNELVNNKVMDSITHGATHQIIPVR